MAIYITSFYPLCSTSQGRKAVTKYNLNPYLDGSCRREPDFMHSFPCITGLCRPNFVKKLEENDIIIYTTNKAGVGRRLLIAILQVDFVFEDHYKASHWYALNNFPIPNNLMVLGNDPFSLDKTHHRYGNEIKNLLKTNLKYRNDSSLIIRLWDKGYLNRSIKQKKVVICHYWNNYRDTMNPIEINKDDNNWIFNRLPGTQNPAELKDEEWKKFQEWLVSIKSNGS